MSSIEVNVSDTDGSEVEQDGINISPTGVANINTKDRMDVYIASLNIESPISIRAYDHNADYFRYMDADEGMMPWMQIPTTLNKNGHNIFNIDPKILIDIKATDDMYGVVKHNKIQTVAKHLSGSIYCAFTATNLNLVVAAITKNGYLAISQPVMNLINSYKGIDVVSELINIANQYASNVIGAYVAKPEAGIPEEMKKDIIINLLFDIRNKMEDGSELTSKAILGIVNSGMNSVFGSSGAGTQSLFYRVLNQQGMFKHMLSSITGKKEEEQKKAFRLGIKVGSKLFSAFQRAGYIYNASSNIWEKDVDIVPQYAHLGGKLRKIPMELVGKCYVKKLQFSPDVVMSDSFSISAVGSHPNISSSRVCIGSELSKKFRDLMSSHMDFVEEYVKFLKEIEETLKRINFDSSFSSADSFYGKNIKDKLTVVKNITETNDLQTKNANHGELRRV
ncbi:MAG: hypothetical protein KAS32_25630 [Candidatus Peribacteraceae bacterium]|nr:hypothetical protein [Candidatus Peribacteraceae bacterium]